MNLHRKYKAKNNAKGYTPYRPSSSSIVLPHAGIIFLQVSSIKSPWKTFSLHRLYHIRIPEDNLDDLVRSFPTWRPHDELIALCPKRQYSLPNQLTNLKRFSFYLLVVRSSHPKLVLLNFSFKACIRLSLISSILSIIKS